VSGRKTIRVALSHPLTRGARIIATLLLAHGPQQVQLDGFASGQVERPPSTDVQGAARRCVVRRLDRAGGDGARTSLPAP